MTYFIGDTHGNWRAYYNLLDQIDEKGDKSCHVGDVGLGFGDDPEVIADENKHRFIRGNHDSLQVCETYPNFIQDGTIEETRIGPIMYVGGAWSIDHMYRKPNVDWWYDEQITLEQAYEFLEVYKKVKPAVMVTHDTSISAAKKLFNVPEDRMFQNTTNMLFEEMFKIHKPKINVFGHWHIDKNTVIDDTRFICVGIDKAIWLDL